MLAGVLHRKTTPQYAGFRKKTDIAEFIIGRAFARPVGSSGLRLLTLGSRSGSWQ
jgi:hypothetical protein